MPALQFRNPARLYQRTAEIAPSRNSAEWVNLFKQGRLLCMRVWDISDILDDPHLLKTGLFSHDTHSSEEAYVRMRPR